MKLRRLKIAGAALALFSVISLAHPLTAYADAATFPDCRAYPTTVTLNSNWIDRMYQNGAISGAVTSSTATVLFVRIQSSQANPTTSYWTTAGGQYGLVVSDLSGIKLNIYGTTANATTNLARLGVSGTGSGNIATFVTTDQNNPGNLASSGSQNTTTTTYPGTTPKNLLDVQCATVLKGTVTQQANGVSTSNATPLQYVFGTASPYANPDWSATGFTFDAAPGSSTSSSGHVVVDNYNQFPTGGTSSGADVTKAWLHDFGVKGIAFALTCALSFIIIRSFRFRSNI